MTALLVIWWIGALGTSIPYWFARGRTEGYVIGRWKTGIAFCFWYFFLIYLFINHNRSTAGQVKTDEAKKRILG
jgi:hypothetical protein